MVFLKSPTPTNSLAKSKIHHSGKNMSLHMHPGFALISLNWLKLCVITGFTRQEQYPRLCCRQEGVCSEVIS